MNSEITNNNYEIENNSKFNNSLNYINCCGIRFPITQERANYSIEYKEFSKIKDECLQAFTKMYNSYKTLENLICNIDDDVDRVFEFALNYYTQKWHKKGYLDITINLFWTNEVSKQFKGGSLLQQEIDYIDAEYDSIMDEICEGKEARAHRKNARGRWIGGGFGMKGAIKGAATAGALNAATGVVHSVRNSIGNALTKMNAKSKLSYIYKDPQTLFCFKSALENDLYCVFLAHLKRCEKYDKLFFEYPDESKSQKALAILSNLKSSGISIDQYPKYILQAYEYSPFIFDLYKTLLHEYFKLFSTGVVGIYNDDYNGLFALSSTFGLSSYISEEIYTRVNAEYKKHFKAIDAVKTLDDFNLVQAKIKKLTDLKNEYLNVNRSLGEFSNTKMSSDLISEIERQENYYLSEYGLIYNKQTGAYEKDEIYQKILNLLDTNRFEEAIAIIQNSNISTEKKNELKKRIDLKVNNIMGSKLENIEEFTDDEGDKGMTLVTGIFSIILGFVLYIFSHNILGTIFLISGIGTLILHSKAKKDMERINELKNMGYTIKTKHDKDN